MATAAQAQQPAPAANPSLPPPAAPMSALPGDAALLAQPCTGLFSLQKTYAHARKWIDSWNSHSVDTVMALYTPDFEFRARGILNGARIGNPRGVLRGQADNRLRWFDPAAKGVKGTSNFRLIGAYSGVRSIAVHYLNARSEPVVEVSEYAADCKIERSNALYGPLPVGDALVTAAFLGTPLPSSPAGGQ
jgi:hypothetical protein